MKVEGDYFISPKYTEKFGKKMAWRRQNYFCKWCCVLLYSVTEHGRMRVRSTESEHYPYCRIRSKPEQPESDIGRVIIE